MYKKCSQKLCTPDAWLKTWRVMKLTFLLLLVAIMQVSATSFAQKVTLTAKNAELITVFNQISYQTGYDFVVTNSILKNANKVTLQAKNVELKDLLDQIFKNQPFEYSINNNTVLVKKKEGLLQVKTSDNNDEVTITGSVMDSKGQPLPGVNIQIRGSVKGTLTDVDGKYTIQVKKGDMLTFSFVGFQKKEVVVGQRLTINIFLEEELMQLGEIVITGYTAKKTSELTGSVQKISGDQLRNGVSSPNILSMLKGKTTGMYITETSSDAGARGQVMLRGQSVLPADRNIVNTATNFGPLIVVDGVITNYTSLQDAVNVQDIEDVIILKDAASTAIYGSRAALGVIVVNTKRAKNGQLSVSLNSRYGITQPTRQLRFMNTSEVISHMDTYMRRIWEQTPSLKTRFATPENFISQNRIYTDADRNRNVDWDDIVYNSGNFKDLSVGITSGTDKTKVYSGIGWYNEDGVRYGNGYDRKNLRLNLDQKISSNLSMSLNLSAIVEKRENRNGVQELYQLPSYLNIYKDDGSFTDSLMLRKVSTSSWSTPTSEWAQNFQGEERFDNTSIDKTQNYLGSILLKYEIIPGLSIQSTNSLGHVLSNLNSYLDPRSFSGKYGGYPYLFTSPGLKLPNGTLTIRNNTANSFLTSNLLSYKKSIGDHNLAILAGQEWGKRSSEASRIDGYNVAVNERNAGAIKNYGDAIYVRYNLPLGLPVNPAGGSYAEKATFSMFSQADYDYNKKYYVSASLRTDASTNFGKKERYGTFYAISGAWSLKQEDFLKENKVINNLKLRFVHGTSGRDLGDDYLNFSLYRDNLRYENDANIGSYVYQGANNEITWETTYNNTLGIDLNLWNRVAMNIDAYHKRSSGLLQRTILPSAQGSFQQAQNIGEIVNKGVELLVTSHNIKSKTFNWHTDFNITFNKNQLTKLYTDSLRDGFTGAYYHHIGEDINLLRAIKFVGINPDNGAPKFENYNANGNLVVRDGIGDLANTRNYQPVGSTTPKFYGGMTNTFSYNDFSLSFDLWFQYGNKMMMSLINNFQDPTAPFGGRNNVVMGANQQVWKGPGDTEANYPDIFSVNHNQWGAYNFRSSFVYGDASHIRLRNIRLAYNLPKDILAKAKIKNGQVYFSADNVHVWKRKSFVGADPEGASISDFSNASGVGINSANPRRFVMGVNVSF